MVSRRVRPGAYEKLTLHVNALYGLLGEMELTEEDAECREEIYYNYQSIVDLISHNEYNIEAAKFNEKLLSSPAKTIGMLLGVTEFEPFA